MIWLWWQVSLLANWKILAQHGLEIAILAIYLTTLPSLKPSAEWACQVFL